MKQKRSKRLKPSKWLSIILVLILLFTKLPFSLVYADTTEEPETPTEEVHSFQEVQEAEVEAAQESHIEASPEVQESQTTESSETGSEEPPLAEEPVASEEEPTIATGSITGYAWLDENEDGIHDAGESLLTDIVLYLFDSNDKTQAIDETVTDGNGAYEFTEVTTGQYYVAVGAQTIGEVEYLVPIAAIQSGADNKFDIDWELETGLSYTSSILVEENAIIGDVNAGMRTAQPVVPMAGIYNVSAPISASFSTLEDAVNACNGNGMGSYTITLAGNDSNQGNVATINNGVNITLTSASSSQVIITQPTQGARHLKIDGGSLTLENVVLEGTAKVYNDSNWWDSIGGVELDNSGSLTVGTNAQITKCFGNQGGGVQAGNGSSVYIIANGSVDTNQSSDIGGGIYATNSTVVLSDNATVGNNIGQWRTGGIHLENSTLILNNNGRIHDNVAKHNEAGGVSAKSGSTIVMNGGSITNNIIEDNGVGGGIFLENSSLTTNDGEISYNSSTSHGGGIYASNSTIDLYGGNIMHNDGSEGAGIYAKDNTSILVGETSSSTASINNNTASDNGGGIYIDNSKIEISGGDISHNTAPKDGGGIRSTGGSIIDILSGAINENTAANGGGISANGGTTITMSDGIISNNTADSRGGGVNLDTDNTSFTMNGGQISDNKAVTGAGIVVDKASFLMNKADVVGNQASGQGGGIFIENGGQVTVENTSKINNNSADTGGGILASANCKDIKITDSTLNGNTAVENGGGLFADNTTIIVDNSTFTNNTAGEYGGGIRLRNTADLVITSSTISSNTASYGGGLSANHGSTVDMSATDIKSNIANHDGGGVNIDIANTVFTMNGGVIENNTALESGGGLFATANSEFTLDGVTVSDNTSLVNGGGLFLMGNVTGEIKASSIVNNSTALNGGGIRIEDSSEITINSSSIDSNTAGYGGGISANGASEIVMNGTSKIISNTATYFGGGVNIDHSGTTFTMNDGLISANTANNGGGVFASAGADFTMNTGDITSNAAANNGGGVYLQASSNLTVVSGTISNNDARNGGGIFTEDYNYHDPLDVSLYYKNITITGGSLAGNTSHAPQTAPTIINGPPSFDKDDLNNDQINYFPNSYKIVYYPNGGSGLEQEEQYKYGTVADVMSGTASGFTPPASNPDYVILYWCETPDGTTGVCFDADGTDSIIIDGDKTLYAIWGAPTSITGIIFVDSTTRNSFYDSGEELSGRTVTLYKYDTDLGDYVATATTTTNSAGEYTFVVEENASYKISVKVVDGNVGQYGFVTKGSDTDSTASHVYQDGFSDPIVTTSSIGDRYTVNAGYIPTIVPTGVDVDSTPWMFYIAISMLALLIMRKGMMMRRYRDTTFL